MIRESQYIVQDKVKKLPIAMVERESGISKDALRAWERRYGFPEPHRDEHGDRCYAPDQVEKLKLIKQLMGKGNRPAKLVPMSMAQLNALLADNSETPDAVVSPLAEKVIELLRASNHPELVNLLTQNLASHGLMRFIQDELAIMNRMIGQSWAQGRISIAQEHLYTEAVQKILRAYLQNLRVNLAGPRVLLATLPGEQHGLGLLMVESVISAIGATPISLGTEVPLNEISTASDAHLCDVVAISFSRARSPSFVTQGVKGLRDLLHPKTELWIGGEGARWLRQPIAGVSHLPDLHSIHEHLISWRK